MHEMSPNKYLLIFIVSMWHRILSKYFLFRCKSITGAVQLLEGVEGKNLQFFYLQKT